MTINPTSQFLIHAFFFLSFQTKLALGMEFNQSVEDNNKFKCIESERQALLSFKTGLLDTQNVLSSWRNEDCCSWRGVQCSNNTGHIIRLDLHGSDDSKLDGKIGSSLANLSNLSYLDLSNNWFHTNPIPTDVIGSLINLSYLNLSYSELGGDLSHLRNLSKLSVLDLGDTYNVYENDDDFGWLSNLSSLKYLDLSSMNLSSCSDWVNIISKLSLLENLFLADCDLPQEKLSSSHISYTNVSAFLYKLDLSNNHFNSSIFPWLLNFCNSLVHLDLSSNSLGGRIPDEFKNMVSLESLDLHSNQLEGLVPDGQFKNMASLEFLDLSFNQLKGQIPDDFENMTNSLVHLDLSSNKFIVGSLKPLGNVCNLKSLSLSDNNLEGLLSDILKVLPECALNSLQDLDLASNKLIGFLPNFTMLPSLQRLNLSNNTLNGSIPESLGQLSDLEYLNLGTNSLEGEANEAHFSKLTKLRYLNLSGNSLILDFKSDWVPPFQLESIFLSSCNLGPLFPKWLRTQNFSSLDISYAKISDSIPFEFWKNLSLYLRFMDLSGNEIKGEVPYFPAKFAGLPAIFLHSNEFTGRIPPFLLQAWILDVSNNKFSDVSSLCEVLATPLSSLDLSNNQLSGLLPNCWAPVLNLRILSSANNSFSGHIPPSLSNLSQLLSLDLSNNGFSGNLPSWLNFTELIFFQVMNNELSGPIPSWIGSRLPNLVYLNLKSNQFQGNLPPSLCSLKKIQVLGISSNSISASIPNCFGNFNALTQRSNLSHLYNSYFSFEDGLSVGYTQEMAMIWKGQERFIKGIVLSLQKSIDLSNNQLTGKIPNEITKLASLINLNLSKNGLTGQIPEKIGQLHSLESLDLSRNQLFGPIPSGFAQISTLSKLDLSYNNLSGKIPIGTQLQLFEAASYEGNSYLCGAPLKECDEEEIQDPSINTSHNANENEDGVVIRDLFISMSVGFVVGFWGIFGSLVLRMKWRNM